MISAVGDTSPQIDPTAFVHPTAVILGDVHIGPHSSIWPGAVLRGDFGVIRVGAYTSVQDNCVVHATGNGTHIGDLCIVGHMAFIEEAEVADACLIGVGSRLLNRVRVGEGAVIAAGAVVTPGTDVPAGRRAQGVPARVTEHRGQTRTEIAIDARAYAAMAARVRESLDVGSPPRREAAARSFDDGMRYQTPGKSPLYDS